MKTITVNTYPFAELSDTAKETARAWRRECENSDSFFSDCVYEDAATIGDIIGIDLNTRRSKNGTYSPNIYYSGFSSQGDGACFEGTYKYKKGSLKAIKQHAPLDTELHQICKALQDIQKKYFYRLTASTKHSGHYYHSGCMRVSVDYIGDYIERETDKGETEITQCLRDFADWIYSRLEDAYDFTMSDENVDDNIILNNYDFYENGEIA